MAVWLRETILDHFVIYSLCILVWFNSLRPFSCSLRSFNVFLDPFHVYLESFHVYLDPFRVYKLVSISVK